MSGARLASEVWVGALVRRCSAAGVGAHVAARGDSTSGFVAIKLVRGRVEGAEVWEIGLLDGGRRGWRQAVPLGPEADADAWIERQRRRDPDLWVIELEDPKGRPWWDEEWRPEA